jgi:hypothetical protein
VIRRRIHGVAAAGAVAHRRHRHASLRASAGKAAIAAASIVAVVHQHGVSNVPVRAGAQSFGPPQRGQVRFGFGCIVT